MELKYDKEAIIERLKAMVNSEDFLPDAWSVNVIKQAIDLLEKTKNE